MADDVTYVIEGAEIIWPNFSGRERTFNAAGDRNFCVRLTEEDAEALSRDGWNVKQKVIERDLDEGGSESFHYLKISVSYKFRSPTIVVVTSETRTMLEQEDLEMLDWAEFESIDLIFRAYDWTIASGASGRKAELKKLFATVVEDPLDKKYGFYS